LRLAQEIWEAVLGQLQLQVNKPNYDTWLGDTTGISCQDDIFTVGVPNIFVAEWLRNRLYSLIQRTLVSVAGRAVDIQFVVQGPGQLDTPAPPALLADGGTSTRLRATPKSPNLRTKYTFDSFVTGECNRLAYAAALSVAEQPGKSYNPLFIYGDTGVGKTHLLQAIGNTLKSGELHIISLNAEQFTTQFVVAARSKRIEEFHHRFHSADVMLLDDVQFLSGKTQTEECFLHLFNELYDGNCQIVVTGDRPPRAITGLGEKLRSRLECGLVVYVEPPRLETRLTILDMKAKKLKMPIPQDALQFLAQQFHHNVRELEGAVNRVVTFAKVSGSELDMAATMQALADMIGAKGPQQGARSPQSIIEAVAGHYGLPSEALTGKARDKRTSTARQVAMFALREHQHLSLNEIGKLLGGRDHTTILHGCQKVTSEMNINAELTGAINDILKRLESRSLPS